MKPTICVNSSSASELELIRKAGFSEIELNFSYTAGLGESERREYLALIAQLGFFPAAGNGFFPQWDAEKGFFQPKFDIGEVRDYIARAFESTSEIKWRSIAFGSGHMRRVPDGFGKDRAFAQMAEFISAEIVPYLEKYGAVLSIEELQASETNFINSCAEAKKLAEAVNHPKVGVLCDFYHMSAAGETAESVPDFAERITHVHIASPSNRRSIPYKSDGDNEKYESFFKKLKACGYDGYVSAEGGIAENIEHGKAYADCFDYLAQALKKIQIPE